MATTMTQLGIVLLAMEETSCREFVTC